MIRKEILAIDLMHEGDRDICPNCGKHSLKFYDIGDMECNNKNCLYAEDAEFNEYKKGGKIKMNKKQLINFEKKIVKQWENAEIPYPIHFSGGNEDELIEIFKDIKKEDYVFSTHRGHYHFLLKGGTEKELEKIIKRGDSMHLFSKKLNFLTSSIVSGCVAIAVGVAWALKRKESKQKVWCFVGDGTEDEGHFYEAVKYIDGHDLPCTFIVEDNDRSVDTPKIERYGTAVMVWNKDYVKKYFYEPTFPHVGTGKFVNFKNGGSGGM